MQFNHRLAGTCRSGDARGSRKLSIYELPLRRMKKDRPLFPRIREREFQLVCVGHDAEAALRVGMRKRIVDGFQSDARRRNATGRELQQRFSRFAW